MDQAEQAKPGLATAGVSSSSLDKLGCIVINICNWRFVGEGLSLQVRSRRLFT